MNLLRGIYGYGFEKPSEIQQTAIVPTIKYGDIIAQAQSGTGKTGTFCIASLQLIDETLHKPQILILSPTRELASQTALVCSNLGSYMDVKVVLCMGGTDVREARHNLRDDATIVVGTLGRIKDMVNKRYLNLSHIKAVILDEADEMLSVGFENDLLYLLDNIPSDVKKCLFSATLPTEIIDLSNRLLNNPFKILLKKTELTLEGIQQFYVDVEQLKYKLGAFLDIFAIFSIAQSIIYVNTKERGEYLADKLNENNYSVSLIHGGLSQDDRAYIMKQFKTGASRILISTDLTARGIDVQSVSLVINYDLPTIQNKENYIHRIGRSGRFGRKGIAVNLITSQEYDTMKELETFYHTQILELPTDFHKLV